MRLIAPLVAGGIALALGAAAFAQHGRGGGPPDQVVDQALRAQERASQAAQRAEAAQQAQNQAQAAADRAQSRASEAADRAQSQANQAAERAQSHAAQAAERAQTQAGNAAARALGRADDAVGRARADVAEAKAAGGLATAEAARAEASGDGPPAPEPDLKTRSRALVAAHPDRLEMAELGAAVRGEIVMVAPSAREVASARAAGFAVTADEMIEGLDLRSVTLRVPAGVSLVTALARLRGIAPRAELTANYVHFPSGSGAARARPASRPAPQLAPNRRVAHPRIGMIDGGVARHPSLAGPIEQRGFRPGAPAPAAHATAIASLMVGGAPMHAVDPGAGLLVADVYGNGPAGGDSLALARALGWMVVRGAPVVLMSLVGPPDPLLGRAVAQVQRKGLLVVAPVGNFGPAAAPAYPASYPGVIAVTAVNAGGRVLMEAGRSLHVDYAAPGADMAAADPGGGLSRVRGTSFAAALVAASLSTLPGRGAALRAALDRRADRASAAANARPTGRGLVCGGCRTFLRQARD